MMGTTISITAKALRAYQAEAEKELLNILKFWKLYGVDEKNGGFVGRLDNAGVVSQDAPKGGVLNARILWTFSAAYRHTQKEEYLQLAHRAFHYLANHFLDKEYGGFFWAVDAKGAPLETRKQIYALSFAIYGFSEYYLASGQGKALEISKELFQWIEQYSFDKKSGGYLEAFSREAALLEDLRLSKKDRNDPKTMNTHLHILEAYTNLYRSWPDEYLAKQLEALIDTFLHNIIDPATGHMKLFFTKDWLPTAEIVSYGHNIEASWLLPEAATVLGNKALEQKVSMVALKMAEAAAEGLQADGSLFHEFDIENNHFDQHREWWVSAEAMVGFLHAYELNGDDHFLQKSIGSWRFAQQFLLDKERGEWFWGINEDFSRMEGEDKIGFWKCPYHNSRACMEVASRCRKLIESTISK